jgi:hypothetical protein
MTTLPDFAIEEILHIATTELVGSVDDIIHRRTLIGMTGRDRPEVRAEISLVLEAQTQRESA